MNPHVKQQLQSIIDALQPEHSLPRDPHDGFWRTIRTAIQDAYLTQAETHGKRDGRAIIMAGPPGAGKSQAVTTARQAAGDQAPELGLTEDGYITIDPDDIKQLVLGNPVPGLDINPDLLTQAQQRWNKLITDHAPGNLADGKPVLRGELATLVHQFSTETADRVRGDLVARSFNIKIEGTLQWLDSPTIGQGPRLIQELRDARYTHATIVAVDSPRELCLEGANQRWQEPRSRNDHTARFTPDTAINRMFDNHTSRCITNAAITHNLAQKQLPDSNLFIVDRATTPPTVHHTNHTGQTRTLTTTTTAKLPPTVLASRRPNHATPTQTTQPSPNPPTPTQQRHTNHTKGVQR